MNFEPVLDCRSTRTCLTGLAAVGILAFAVTAGTEIKPATLFGDHMVLQHGVAAPMWGTAAPDEEIRVSFGAVTSAGKADSTGKWLVKLDPLPVSATPSTLTIAGNSQTITIRNVLVGDVWLCSGQSNMAFQLQHASNAQEELAAADRPQLRLFQVQHQTAAAPRSTCTGQWQPCTAASARGFSAVGYFFGKEIAASQRIPVGMIESAVGATPAQAWVSLEALQADPDLEKTYVEPVLPLIRDPQAAQAAHDRWLAQGGADYKKLQQKWYQDRYLAQKTGTAEPAKPEPATPEPLYFDNAIRFPTVLFNGMIAPLAPFAIQGAIWYQGESNTNDAWLYGKLLTAMIRCWRDAGSRATSISMSSNCPTAANAAASRSNRRAVGRWCANGSACWARRFPMRDFR